jgi:hypothetical protein
VSLFKRPVDLARALILARVVFATVATTAAPPVFAAVATYKDVLPDCAPKAALLLLPPTATWGTADCETGAVATDSIPANSAVVAVSAMRLRSVVFDIFFLSLSQTKYFLIWL